MLPYNPWYSHVTKLYYSEPSTFENTNFLDWLRIKFGCTIDFEGDPPTFNLLFKTEEDRMYFKMVVDNTSR